MAVPGIIPACAGNTYVESWSLPPTHARGAPARSSSSPPFRRIVPASAGSTPGQAHSMTPSPDHPRMREEHHLVDLFAQPASGSSPHARGALRSARVMTVGLRIIPASAGSTVHVLHHPV